MNSVIPTSAPVAPRPGDVVNGHVLIQSSAGLTWLPLNAPADKPRPVATVTQTSGTVGDRITATRILLAICTCGISLLFTGTRRKNKVRTTSVTTGVS